MGAPSWDDALQNWLWTAATQGAGHPTGSEPEASRANPGPVMRPTPRREGRKARGSLAKSKLELIGRQRVSRNPLPSRIPVPCLPNLIFPAPVWNLPWPKSPKSMLLRLRPRPIFPVTPMLSSATRKSGKIKEKPHRWIEARVRCLDPAGYMEKINSLWCFRRNAGCFALQIVAIADWGQKYTDVGFRFPIPTLPQFLFTPVTNSHQGRAQVPVKPSHLHNPRGDVCLRSREAWKWMVAVLQFWGDEASATNGIVYRGPWMPRKCLGRIRP